jgi:hypothetical protein
MVLHILFPQDIDLFECDQYHPFLESFDIMLTKTWLSKLILSYSLDDNLLMSFTEGLSYPFALGLLALLPWPEYKRVGVAAENFAKVCRAL